MRLDFGFDSKRVLSLTALVKRKAGELTYMNSPYPPYPQQDTCNPENTHTGSTSTDQRYTVSKDRKMATFLYMLHRINQSPSYSIDILRPQLVDK